MVVQWRDFSLMMADWKHNLENVIEKWGKKGPPAHVLVDKTSKTGNCVPRIPSNINRSDRRSHRSARARREEKAKDREFWLSLEQKAAPKKFKLIAPILKEPVAPYQVYQCRKCQEVSKDHFDVRNLSKSSTLFNVYDINSYTGRRSSFWRPFHDARFILSRKLHICTGAVVRSDEIDWVSNEIARKSKQSLPEDEENDRQKTLSQNDIWSLYGKMASSVSRLVIRVACWVLLKVLRKNFSSICCQSRDIIVLKEVTQKNVPIIYLPVGKSIMDYVIIYFALSCNNLRIPFTAVPGSFCTSRFLRYLLRKLGVFFIQESGNKPRTEIINGVILQRYVEQLLVKKQSLQIAVNDCKPGQGNNISSSLIPIVTNAVVEGVVDDILAVPVEISYEKEIEEAPSNNWNLVKIFWRGLKSTFNGMVHVRFGLPISLKDFSVRESKFPARKHKVTNGPMSSRVDVFSRISTKEVASSLVQHVLSDCSNLNVITCPSMVSFLLITKHRDGTTIDMLESSFEWLKGEIVDLERSFGFDGSTQNIVKYAIDVLVNQGLMEIKTEVVDERKVVIVKAAKNSDKLLEYSRMVTKLFAVKAVAATSIVGLVGGTDLINSGQRIEDEISRAEALGFAELLCKLLMEEFISLPPCTDITTVVTDALDSYVNSGTLINVKASYPNEAKRQYDFDDEYYDYIYDGWYEEEPDVFYEVDLTDEKKESLLYLQSLIAPFLETAWFVIASLPEVLKDEKIAVHEIVNSLHERFQKRIKDGLTVFSQTTSLGTFYNINNVLLEIGALEKHAEEHCEPKIKLTTAYMEDGRFHELQRKIDLCR